MPGRIASILRAESGWRVICVCPTEDGKSELRFTFVHSWGLLFPAASQTPSGLLSGIPGTYVPLSMSGESLNEREGYLGLSGPEEDDDAAVERIGGTATRLKTVG